MDQYEFAEIYFLSKFYYSKLSSLEIINRIIGNYLDIYSTTLLINPHASLDELEDSSTDCFYDEFYNNLKWDFKGIGRNWC